MRASRLISLLLLLQARGPLTGDELSLELGVSERTIQRDAAALAAAGIPIVGERGRAGGYRLMGGYRTKLTGLTRGEAESLVLAGVPDAARDLGLGALLTAAQVKLRAALPADLRAAASRSERLFYLDPIPWFRERESPAQSLSALAGAVWRDRRIQIRYQAREKMASRVLDPLGLVLKAGVWYLVAANRQGVRVYRVARIRGVSVKEEKFERPRDFDLASYWASKATDFEMGLARVPVTLRVAECELAQLRGIIEAPGRAVVDAGGKPDDHGWKQLRVPFDTLEHARAQLLGLGAQVEVLEPRRLRESIRQVVADMSRLYGENH
jgi:predicted DNA-binding transcriptional regulator YafY